VIYELARAFLTGRNVNDVKATCDFLADVVASRVVWKREMAHSSGGMRSPTTNRPPGKAAAGGMRHGEGYQEVGAAA
jgi:hypothetical protein